MKLYDYERIERESKKVTVGYYEEAWIVEYCDRYDVFMQCLYSGNVDHICVLWKKEVELNDNEVEYHKNELWTYDKFFSMWMLCPWRDKIRKLVFDFIGEDTKVNLCDDFTMMNNKVIENDDMAIDEKIYRIIKKISNLWENDNDYFGKTTFELDDLEEIIYYLLYEDNKEKSLIDLALIL